MMPQRVEGDEELQPDRPCRCRPAIQPGISGHHRIDIAEPRTAGAGIVADSVPEAEYQECLNKARAVLRAIERARGR